MTTLRHKQGIIVMALSSTNVNARSYAQTQSVPSINTLMVFVCRYVNAVMEGAVCSLAIVRLPLLILSTDLPDIRYAAIVYSPMEQFISFISFVLEIKRLPMWI